MSLYPVKQCQFILCQFLQNLGFLVACTKLLFHLFGHFRNTGISGMLIEGFEQIQLGVLLDLNTQIVQLFDRCVAGQEILRTRSKRNDL